MQTIGDDHTTLWEYDVAQIDSRKRQLISRRLVNIFIVAPVFNLAYFNDILQKKFSKETRFD